MARETEAIAGVSNFALEPDEIRRKEVLARSGDVGAAFALYQHYNFLTTDGVTSAAWLRLAAELGHPTAQYNLAYFMLEEADPERRAEAVEWLQKLASTGDEGAKRLLEKAREPSSDASQVGGR